MSLTFPQIGSTTDAFFWAAKFFNNKLYFGSYGYPKAYNYSPWTWLKNFGAGESITAMGILDGKLYCITENQGKIYRMNTADPTTWTVVHDDTWPYGLGMAVLGSYIYGSFNKVDEDETKTLYSLDGDTWNEADHWGPPEPPNYYGGQIWVLVAYNGKVYELGLKGAFSTGTYWARRGMTTSWADVAALCSDSVVGFWRVGLVFNGKLYLGMGDRSDGKSKVYRFDGTNLSSELFSITAFYAHYACLCNGYMYWLFGPFMNQASSATVYYHLYRTPTGDSGDWEFIKTFSANPILSHGKYRTRGCLGCLNNKLYIGVQNKVYRMDEEEPPPESEITYKFQVRNSPSESWSQEYDDITKVPNARYIKITASFSRDSLICEMPTLEDMTLKYKILTQPIIF